MLFGCFDQRFVFYKNVVFYLCILQALVSSGGLRHPALNKSRVRSGALFAKSLHNVQTGHDNYGKSNVLRG